jgi:hypothetical protein
MALNEMRMQFASSEIREERGHSLSHQPHGMNNHNEQSFRATDLCFQFIVFLESMALHTKRHHRCYSQGNKTDLHIYIHTNPRTYTVK